MKRPRLGIPSLVPTRRKLRKEPTKAEQILWKHLHSKRLEGFKFRRQHGIGSYIVDFCAPRQEIVIEVDGDIHALPDQQKMDQKRQKEIESLGYQFLRYTNEEVLRNTEAVLEDIWRYLTLSGPPPAPSFVKRGERKLHSLYEREVDYKKYDTSLSTSHSWRQSNGIFSRSKIPL